jgi:hypothetical protein
MGGAFSLIFTRSFASLDRRPAIFGMQKKMFFSATVSASALDPLVTPAVP